MAKQQNFGTILRGKFKAQKVAFPPLDSTRPTKQIVIGSFIDSTLSELMGANFIEAFGGSGLMAANALSVGARAAWAIEFNKEAFKTTKQNALKFGFNALLADAFVAVPKLVSEISNSVLTSSQPYSQPNLQKPNLVLYLDPPFSIREGFDEVYQKCVRLLKSVEDEVNLCVFEHDSEVVLQEQIGKFSKSKQRKFGRSSLSFFQKLSG